VAGPPQENSWPQQGHGYSQGAPGYGPAYDQQGQPAPYQQQEQAFDQQQPGTYDQQPGAYEQQGAYQQTPAYEQQAYQQPQPAYEQPTVYDQQQQYDQSGQAAQFDQQPHFDPSGQQAYAQAPQSYPGQPQPFEQPALPGPAPGQQQGWEQWRLPQQQAPSQKQSRPARTERGFVGSLFDFGFTSFVTPKIIKILYVLVTVWTILWALAFLRLGFRYGGMAGGFGTLIIVDPILILVSLGVFRVVLEFFMVTFRMQEDLKALRERATGSAAQARGDRETAVDGGSAPDGV
jgi:uncharacterized membrane protein